MSDDGGMSDAILFDLDRTLIDLQSFTDYGAARRDAEALITGFEGLEVPPTDWSVDTVAAMALLVACSGDPRWTQVSEAIEKHELAAVPQSTLMPECDRAWRLSAGMPRAVVTLLPERVVRTVLAHHKLATDELVVIGRRADQRPKPHPDGLVAACAQLGVAPSEALMIGDSAWDLEAARAAGCAFVGVPTHTGNLPPGTLVAADVAAAVRVALV